MLFRYCSYKRLFFQGVLRRLYANNGKLNPMFNEGQGDLYVDIVYLKYILHDLACRLHFKGIW